MKIHYTERWPELKGLIKEIDERNRVNLTMKGVSDEEKALCEQQNP